MPLDTSITMIMWIVGISLSLMMGTLALYGKWIWDLNKKVAHAVTGSECEKRNENHYGENKDLRLEVKKDIEILGTHFEKDMRHMSDRFADGMKRLGTERDHAISDLKEQIINHHKIIAAQNQANLDQHQANFELLVGVLKEIGCNYPSKA